MGISDAVRRERGPPSRACDRNLDVGSVGNAAYPAYPLRSSCRWPTAVRSRRSHLMLLTRKSACSQRFSDTSLQRRLLPSYKSRIPLPRDTRNTHLVFRVLSFGPRLFVRTSLPGSVRTLPRSPAKGTALGSRGRSCRGHGTRRGRRGGRSGSVTVCNPDGLSNPR